MKTVEVYNNWDPLEEIWLGDVWPSHFYDDLKPDIRDAFYQLTEWTKEDLKVIENKFKEFGVSVLRPTVDTAKENFLEEKTGKLLKPPICPRDDNAVIGNSLYVNPQPVNSYTGIISLYDPSIVKRHDYTNASIDSPMALSGANIVKLGRDIIFDHQISYRHDKKSRHERKFMTYHGFKTRYLPQFENDYRVHFSATGGHLDGCFMPVRPGLLLATRYFDEYDIVFPGWEQLIISDPTYIREKESFKHNFDRRPDSGFKWTIPGLVSTPHFNGYLNKYCKDWIGNYKETYFEVNIIMLDENNMMCIDTSGAHQPLFELFDKKGINLHIMPWRTRGFWDGGMHCITLDTKRKSMKKDYFPERGDNGLSSVLDPRFNHDVKIFLQEYNNWVKQQTPEFLSMLE